jgi:pyruvate,orthophosphate dikinase
MEVLQESPAGAPGPSQIAAVDGACPLTREELGGKAWGINRMRALGLPVPPAFTLTTHACQGYHSARGVLQDRLWQQIVEHVDWLQGVTGQRFGSAQSPLLVSVRSGAARSMPGMMDTILNLGINAQIETALGAQPGARGFAADTRRRFEEQYRKVVLGGRDEPIPADPWLQLRNAVAAVFDSWHSARAQAYRRNRGLPEAGCTAVTIQAMVFGNRDQRSGTGVLFSRNPITGERPAWGEWLAHAQGEAVVSGADTPRPLPALREQLPEVHAELTRAAHLLEADARDIQDIEFTVESGRLWLLQARVAKRSPQAAVRAAVAFAEEGLITRAEALRRLSPEQVRQLLAPRLAPGAAQRPPLAAGIPACPGTAVGVVVTDPAQAQARAQRGEDVILARPTTSPDDLHGIIAARGLVTEQGGSTSHAAVVSRELGRPCVVGCGAGSVTVLAGRRITLDGTSGQLWAGDLTVEHAGEADLADLRTLLEWGLPQLPMRLLTDAQAPADTVDLDAFGEGWRYALARGSVVRGAVLETDAGIRAALAAGVDAAVIRNRLPALLACLQPDTPAPAAAPRGAAAASAAGGSELALLRLLGLKRRGSTALLAEAMSVQPDVVPAACAALLASGLCAQSRDLWQLTAAGRERLAALLAAERASADRDAVVVLYDEFRVFDAELKQAMTDWQLKPGGEANDHRDGEYDRTVLQRLADLHRRATPLLQRLPQLSPRLAGYGERLDRAAARIAAGDTSYVARVLADSYHTVWFELHEDLLSLAGSTRQAEAGARPQAR